MQARGPGQSFVVQRGKGTAAAQRHLPGTICFGHITVVSERHVPHTPNRDFSVDPGADVRRHRPTSATDQRCARTRHTFHKVPSALGWTISPTSPGGCRGPRAGSASSIRSLPSLPSELLTHSCSNSDCRASDSASQTTPSQLSEAVSGRQRSEFGRLPAAVRGRGYRRPDPRPTNQPHPRRSPTPAVRGPPSRHPVCRAGRRAADPIRTGSG